MRSYFDTRNFNEEFEKRLDGMDHICDRSIRSYSRQDLRLLYIMLLDAYRSALTELHALKNTP